MIGKTNHLFLRDSKYPKVGPSAKPWTKAKCVHLLRLHMGHVLDCSVFSSFYSDGCPLAIFCPRSGPASLLSNKLISVSPGSSLWPLELTVCFPAGAQDACVHLDTCSFVLALFISHTFLKVCHVQDTSCVYTNPQLHGFHLSATHSQGPCCTAWDCISYACSHFRLLNRITRARIAFFLF